MLLFAAGGSAAGGVGRYLPTGLLQPRSPGAFPVGTFVVNLAGAIKEAVYLVASVVLSLPGTLLGIALADGAMARR